jgi:hypothetical protein
MREFVVASLKASNGAGLPAQGAARRSATVKDRRPPQAACESPEHVLEGCDRRDTLRGHSKPAPNSLLFPHSATGAAKRLSVARQSVRIPSSESPGMHSRADRSPLKSLDLGRCQRSIKYDQGPIAARALR